MDGTLSAPRKIMIDGMPEKLIELSDFADLGIVTGSGIQYIKQQCAALIDNIEKLSSTLTLFPCNGTQVYKINSPQNIKCVFSENMKIELKDSFNEILELLLKEQSLFIKMLRTSNLSELLGLTGTFIQYRNSMLNWCPIGRDASDSDREAFVKFDKKHRIRERLVSLLEDHRIMMRWPIQFALGGSTSIDIYPRGWDKTFVLKHINHSKRDVYFVGDRCQEGGNDKTIYEEIKVKGTAYETVSPENTLQIVDKIKARIYERS